MSRNHNRHRSSSYGSAFCSSPTFMTTPFLHISMTMYSESSSGSSRTSTKLTTFGWLSFFIIAISSRIRSRELLGFPDSARCNGELKPLPAMKWPGTRGPFDRRKRFDCARLRNLDFENSLTAYKTRFLRGGSPKDRNSSGDIQEPYASLTYSSPNWSTARCTAPKEPLPISSLIKY
jgi:hypothetical protein